MTNTQTITAAGAEHKLTLEYRVPRPGAMSTAKGWTASLADGTVPAGGSRRFDTEAEAVAATVSAIESRATRPAAQTVSKPAPVRYSANDGGVSRLLGTTATTTARRYDCHYCGLDSRTCDCR